MASIKQVAIKAGVSVATVSRVFSSSPHVRPEMREHILKVADELGYRPNRIARSLRKQSSRVIGLLVSDVRNPFFVEIARAIEDVANSHQMSVFLCNTDENPEKEQTYLETLLDELVAGMILSPTRESGEFFDFVLKSDTPIVAIDRRIRDAPVDCVLTDNVQSAQLLTTHLISNGYTHLGAIFGLENSTTGRERMQGYKLALLEQGVPFNPGFACFVDPVESTSEKIVSQWLNTDNYPTAIISGNNLITMGAVNAIYKAGLSIPEQIAIAGFDDNIWMPHIGPGITVISQPVYEMGRTAADLLFQRLLTPSRPPREVILKGNLVVRGSTRPSSMSES